MGQALFGAVEDRGDSGEFEEGSGGCLETRQAGSLFSKYPEITSDTNHVTAANGVDLNKGGTSLQIDCPSGQAEALRQRIAQEEAAGRSKDEVVAGIHDEYGEIIWQAPRAAGGPEP